MIFQRTIGETLSRAEGFQGVWLQKLYDALNEGRSPDSPEDYYTRGKCGQAISRLYDAYGTQARNKFSVRDIDASMAWLVINYLSTTRGHFDWLQSARSAMSGLVTKRNLFQHSGAQDLRTTLHLVFGALAKLEEALPRIQKQWPEEFPADLPSQWLAKTQEIADQALTESADASAVLRELKEEEACPASLSPELRGWLLQKAVGFGYPPSCWDESMELMEKAHGLYELPYNCYYYLNRVRLDSTLSVNDACFTREAVDQFLALLQETDSADLSAFLQQSGGLGGSGSQPVRQALLNAANRRSGWDALANNARPSAYPGYAVDGFLTLLGICFLLRDRISETEKLRRLEALDRYRLVREIIDRRESTDLTFVSLKWDTVWPGGRNETANVSTVESILAMPEPRRLKLFGEAGCGKTTSMEELVYLEAKRFLSGEGNKLPVLIPLRLLPDSETPLLDALAERLFRLKPGQKPDALQQETAAALLERNGVTLYLDGLNEILERTQQDRFRNELNTFLRRYSALSVILSDRSEQKVLHIMDQCVKLFFDPLGLDEILGYIRSCCRDPQLLASLVSALEEKVHVAEKFRTPIQINYLMDQFAQSGKLPYESGGTDYIRFLLDRERQKGDRLDGAEDYLGILALLIDKLERYQNGLSRSAAERLFARLERDRGWTHRDSREFLAVLVGMSILTFREHEDENGRTLTLVTFDQPGTCSELSYDYDTYNDPRDLAEDLRDFLTDEDRERLLEQ